MTNARENPDRHAMNVLFWDSEVVDTDEDLARLCERVPYGYISSAQMDAVAVAADLLIERGAHPAALEYVVVAFGPTLVLAVCWCEYCITSPAEAEQALDLEKTP